MSPAQYVALPLEKMEDLAQDYINDLQTAKNPRSGKQYAPSYVENNLDAIRNWASWNRKKFLRKIKIPYADSTPTLDNEIVPTPSEVRRVLYADTTSLRTRLSIAIMAFSGCRPGTGRFSWDRWITAQGSPSTRLDLNEMKAEFGSIPTLITVRDNLSKMGRQSFTFLPEEDASFSRITLTQNEIRRKTFALITRHRAFTERFRPSQ